MFTSRQKAVLKNNPAATPKRPSISTRKTASQYGSACLSVASAFQRMAERASNISNPNSHNAKHDMTPASHSQLPTSADNTNSNGQSSASNEAIPKRALQCVLTNTQKAQIASWMIDHAQSSGPNNIISAAVKQFPNLFRSSYKANIQKASRYWKDRHTLVDGHNRSVKRNKFSFVKLTKTGLQPHFLKARKGRGRKQAKWVTALQSDLLNEFDQMRTAGVKFNARLLRRLTLSLIGARTEGDYHVTMNDPKSGNPIKDHITSRWVQTFMERFHIVSRAQCGKLMVSPKKQEQIEREVAFHLGQLARDFRTNSLREEDVFNADETHFCINMHEHKKLALVGEKNVRYADVVSGDDGMTMMVLISGGTQARLETPMMIFKNTDKNYPIRGVSDDVPGVVYRSGPKAWMDKRVFLEWVREKRIFKPLPNNRKRVLYVDNVNTHDLTDEVRGALAESNTEVRYFPCNATHLVQPADSFIIQKLKTYWRNDWDDTKMDLISNSLWADGANGSGKLSNPGKRHLLKFASKSVRAVSAQRDDEGVSYARKAMIRCGMGLNLNGQWEERQLFPELQAIINRYHENFDGQPVGMSS